MPFLIGAAIVGAVFTAFGAGVVNKTEPTPVGGKTDAGLGVLKWPLIIGGGILVYKFGSKFLKKI